MTPSNLANAAVEAKSKCDVNEVDPVVRSDSEVESIFGSIAGEIGASGSTPSQKAAKKKAKKLKLKRGDSWD